MKHRDVAEVRFSGNPGMARVEHTWFRLVAAMQTPATAVY